MGVEQANTGVVSAYHFLLSGRHKPELHEVLRYLGIVLKTVGERGSPVGERGSRVVGRGSRVVGEGHDGWWVEHQEGSGGSGGRLGLHVRFCVFVSLCPLRCVRGEAPPWASEDPQGGATRRDLLWPERRHRSAQLPML